MAPNGALPSPTQEEGAEGLKQVTEGVGDVDISDSKEVADTASDAAASAIPLPGSPGLEPGTEVAESTGPEEREATSPVLPAEEVTSAPIITATEIEAEDVSSDRASPTEGIVEGKGKEVSEGEKLSMAPVREPPEDEEASTSFTIDNQDPSDLRSGSEPVGQIEGSQTL